MRKNRAQQIGKTLQQSALKISRLKKLALSRILKLKQLAWTNQQAFNYLVDYELAGTPDPDHFDKLLRAGANPNAFHTKSKRVCEKLGEPQGRSTLLMQILLSAKRSSRAKNTPCGISYLIPTLLQYDNINVTLGSNNEKGYHAVACCMVACPSYIPILLDYDFERAKKNLPFDASQTIKLLERRSLIPGCRRYINTTLIDECTTTAKIGMNKTEVYNYVEYSLDILESWLERGMDAKDTFIGLQAFLKSQIEDVLRQTCIDCVSSHVLSFLAPVDVAVRWDQWVD